MMNGGVNNCKSVFSSEGSQNIPFCGIAMLGLVSLNILDHVCIQGIYRFGEFAQNWNGILIFSSHNLNFLTVCLYLSQKPRTTIIIILIIIQRQTTTKPNLPAWFLSLVQWHTAKLLRGYWHLSSSSTLWLFSSYLCVGTDPTGFGQEFQIAKAPPQ